MAPEQAAGDPVDGRTDLYAVGCVLYAMLTGSPPFTGDGPISVVYQHLNRAPAPVRSHRGDVPPGLDHLVGQLLAKNPADRPGDAAQVQARLAGWAAQPGRAGRDTLVINPAAPGSFPTGRAAAAVATPTRTLPAGTPVGDRPPDMVGDRRRVTPGRLAALAAVIVILLIGAVLATQLTGTPSQHQAAPPASTPATTAPAPTAAPPSTTAPTSPTPSPSAAADQVTALRVAVQQLAQTGQLDPHAAQDLGHQLDDLTRTLTRGQAHDTLGRIAALQTKLTQLRNDNKITPDGYTTLTASLNQLAGSLPPPTAGNG
jgi:serine/threonine-protein kinase